jgi:pimeloyl-ACP methyl ester carboxylesterase
MQDTSRRVVVFGHSASCQIAAHVAAMNPTRVTGLVLVGPTTDPTAATWPRLIARWLATARHETPKQVPALLRQYRRTGLGAMRRAMDVARRDRIDDTLGHTPSRILVLRGRHDRICPPGWAAAVANSAGAGSRAVSLSAGGHMVPFTHAPLVAAEVAKFLDS